MRYLESNFRLKYILSLWSWGLMCAACFLCQMSYTLWRASMYVFWWVIIIYSMAVLIILYTYQFQDFPVYWHNNTGLSNEMWVSMDGSSAREFNIFFLYNVIWKENYWCCRMISLTLEIILILLYFFHSILMYRI